MFLPVPSAAKQNSPMLPAEAVVPIKDAVFWRIWRPDPVFLNRKKGRERRGSGVFFPVYQGEYFTPFLFPGMLVGRGTFFCRSLF